jgi:hypothetical protein
VPTSLTAAELRALFYEYAQRHDSPDPLLDKLSLMIAEASAVRQLGAKCFEWRLPLFQERRLIKGKRAGQLVKVALTPSLNVYARMHKGQRIQLQKLQDVLLMAELYRWPNHAHRGRFRALRLTRFSSVEPDEISADAIGGKTPIDRLVEAGILRGDAGRDLHREARWERAKAGGGALLIEVFDVET